MIFTDCNNVMERRIFDTVDKFPKLEPCSLNSSTDHSNHKKHDMMLNLGVIAKNNGSTDQTPTPTRFIRNCEEIGLFKDLQNVNPFEETFRKALETKTDKPEPFFTSDDTLHTPNILPYTIQEVAKAANNEIISISDRSLSTAEEEEEEDKDYDDDDDDVLVIVDDEKLEGNVSPKKASPKKPSPNIYSKEVPYKVKRREMNRLAQMRCREKRKQQTISALTELDALKDGYRELQQENKRLKQELQRMKTRLAQVKCSCMNGSNELHKAADAMRVRKIVPVAAKIYVAPQPVVNSLKTPLLPKITSVGTLKDSGNVDGSVLYEYYSVPDVNGVNNK